MELVKECLNNDPDLRPTTDDLLTRLKRMREEVEGEYGYPVKLDMARVKLAKEVKLKDRQLTQQQVQITYFTYIRYTITYYVLRYSLVGQCLQEY